MKTMYRIGTLPMGIMLILVGIIMFISQWLGLEYVQYIFKLWPIVLIIMGFEILYYTSKIQDDNMRLKYDFWSIFMLFVMIFLSVIAFVAGNLTEEIIKYFV